MNLTQEEKASCRYGSVFLAVFAIASTIVFGMGIKNVFYIGDIAWQAKQMMFYIDHYVGYFITQGSLMTMRTSLIGIILIFYYLYRNKNQIMVSFASVLGIIGASLGVVKYTADLFYMPLASKIFLASPPEIQQILFVKGAVNLDFNILSFGFVGVWFMVMAYFAKQSKWIGYLMVLIGVGYVINSVLITSYNTDPMVVKLIVFLWLILLPIWSVLEILYLRKLSK